MWEARTQAVPSGSRYQIVEEGSVLSFRELFDRLEKSSPFARWYTDALARATPRAFFWEHPALTHEKLDEEAEFVLIESDSLARLEPDPHPFERQFASDPEAEVLTFPNLGGDALLVVPTPLGPLDAYPHLAAFLRRAPSRQVRALWRAAARLVRENLGPSPRWLSTAGLGVSWLHLRLDTRPKYYRFAPYKAEPGRGIAADAGSTS